MRFELTTSRYMSQIQKLISVPGLSVSPGFSDECSSQAKLRAHKEDPNEIIYKGFDRFCFLRFCSDIIKKAVIAIIIIKSKIGININIIFFFVVVSFVV